MISENAVELERAIRKTRAILNARFALRRALQKIDFDLDVVKPALKEIRSDAAIGNLPVFELDQ
jgi:hypothetical protein